MLEFKTVNERQRKYLYPDGQEIVLSGVVSIAVSDSGNHRLNTADGKKHIIAPGWRHIEIDAAEWSI